MILFVWILWTLNASYFVNNLFITTKVFSYFGPKSCLALERIRVCLLFRFELLRHWVWQRLLSLKLYLSVLYLCICLSVYFVFVFIYLSCYSGLGEWWDIGRVARRLPLHRTLHCPPPQLEFSPPWARGQDPSLSSTTGSGKRAFLSRLSNFISPSRLKPLSCTSHLSHDIRKDFQTQEGPISILGMEPKNQVNRATRSRVMAISEFSSERAKWKSLQMWRFL